MSEKKSDNELSFGSRMWLALGVFLRALLRLLILILIGGLIGGLLYYAVLQISQNIVAPLQNQSVRLEALETRQASNQSQLDDRLLKLSQRVSDLENQSRVDAEMQSKLQNGVSAMQESLDDHSARLAELDDLLARINSLEIQASYNSTQIADVEQTVKAESQSLSRLSQDVMLLRALELINRSRFYILQANYGMAASDVNMARDLLANLQQTDLPSYQIAALNDWSQRLDMVTQNLPFAPRIAAYDLEITWGLIAAGLPGPSTPTPNSLTRTPTAQTLTQSPALEALPQMPGASPTPTPWYFNGETPTPWATSTPMPTTPTVTPQ